MGCSNQHPHGQIWANETVPVLPAAEGAKQKEYLEKNKTCLLCDYVNLEKNMQARIVLEHADLARPLTLNASYQGCSDKGLCYPPIEKVIVVELAQFVCNIL